MWCISIGNIVKKKRIDIRQFADRPSCPMTYITHAIDGSLGDLTLIAREVLQSTIALCLSHAMPLDFFLSEIPVGTYCCQGL